MWHKEKFEDKRKPVLEVDWGVAGIWSRNGGAQRKKAGIGKQQHELCCHLICGE